MIVIVIAGDTGFNNSDRRFIIKSPDGKLILFEGELSPEFRASDLYHEIGKFLESSEKDREGEMTINQVLADQFINEQSFIRQR